MGSFGLVTWVLLFGLPILAIVVIIALARNWSTPVEHPDRDEEPDRDDI